MIGEKDREEGMRMGNIIGVVAVVMVILAIVLIAFSSTASATLCSRTYTSTGGNITYEGEFKPEPDQEMQKIKDEKKGEISNVYAGEEIRFLRFENEPVNVTVSGPYTKDKAEEYSGYPHIDNIVDAGDEWDSEGKPTKGYYRVEDADLKGGWFQLMKQSFSVELGEKREKVREGENFSLRIKDNNKKQGEMKLTIEDDDGFSIMNVNGTDIYEVLVAYKKERDFEFADNKTAEGIVIEDVEGISINPKDKELVFDTSKLDMEEGKYKIILEDSATEEKDDVKIEVEERYLDVECNEEVVMDSDIILIIKSSFYEEQATVTVEDIPKAEGIHVVTLDEEGKKKVKIHTEDLDYGTYKITVEVSNMKKTVYVTIKREGSSLEVPDNATIGDIVHIEGSSDFGNLAVLVIDDVFKGEARISDDKFDWDWDTGGELGGYRGIEVFIVDAHNFSVGDSVSDEWQKENGVDASAGIFLLLPMFTMTVPEDIAEGDDAVISGEATGADQVYLIVINYKGEVMFPSNGIARATPVDDGAWEEQISDLDNGRYVVISIDKGRDEETYAMDNGVWAAGDESKTMEQRVAILEDAMTSAGSDDMFELAYFSVSTPQVSLDLPETAEVDDEILVTAETNIKDGEKAFLSLSFNSNIIKTTSTLVKDGRVNANINTSGLQPGRYNIAVDVSGRAHDAKE
ncbi:hypothetical protein C5S30_00505, partial [ANME-1 cluster archaeon GoMg4]|nr:hypothetical protein [ANME-1 cluster archaeon GoMg4]